MLTIFMCDFHYLVLDVLNFSVNLPQMNATERQGWYVNIVSGDGLSPLGDKPLPEPMLTKLDDHVWHAGVLTA